jgi:predicted neutral ceramidase superfamily lipid hydrolase
MKIREKINPKNLYYILCGIVILEMIAAVVSIFIASEPTIRDTAISNVLLGVFSIVLFTLPFLIESKWNVSVPNKMMHILSGVIISIIGFEVVHFTTKSKIEKGMPSGLIAVFAFTFSVALLVLWEFYEFFIDTIAYQVNDQTERNMQRYQWLYEGQFFPQDYGLIDTMLDLLVGVGGAAVVSVIGWRILINKRSS